MLVIVKSVLFALFNGSFNSVPAVRRSTVHRQNSSQMVKNVIGKFTFPVLFGKNCKSVLCKYDSQYVEISDSEAGLKVEKSGGVSGEEGEC